METEKYLSMPFIETMKFKIPLFCIFACFLCKPTTRLEISSVNPFSLQRNPQCSSSCGKGIYIILTTCPCEIQF
jgi:hypothetical protein